jgi:CDP-glucose 4,6-dehydratase
VNNLKKFFKNKRIFITGHTGFKGTWLTTCLTNFGAKILGYSKNDEKRYSYEKICAFNKVQNVYADILDYKSLKNKIKKFNPQIIFHLAAKALVSESYKDPYKTIETNTLGTLNIIEISRNLKNLKSLVIITSDKCYLNKEFKKGYKENDILGGDDPYSASKASAELIFNAYSKSFFNFQNKFGFATARAGNVIGGGDWSNNRIIPDSIKSIINKKKLIIRNPNSTRPWQHVLEPISGYLLLAKKLYENKKKYSGSWNFGPSGKETMCVKKVVRMLFLFLGIQKNIINKKSNFKEANLLKLNSNKALKKLNWRNTWNMKTSIRETAQWYKCFLNKEDIKKFTIYQINNYFNIK